MDVAEFLFGEPVPSGVGVMFRSSIDAGATYWQEFAGSHVAPLLGDITRRLRLIAEAEVDDRQAALPPISRARVLESESEWEADARAARVALGLTKLGPIHSVVSLLRRHGVLVVWLTDDDQVPRWLRGASFREPVESVFLAAPRVGRSGLTSARFTLAHELGHLLFDHCRGKAPLMYSPDGRAATKTVRPFSEFERLEDAADAFAACFLAPAAAVRSLVGDRDAEDPQVVLDVRERFGIGFEVALNRLVAAGCLSQLQRDGLLYAGGVLDARFDRFTDDQPTERELGLNRGDLRARIADAVRRKRVEPSVAYELLGLPLHESLDGVLPALWDIDRVVADRAETLLRRSRDPRHVIAATRVGDGDRWRVRLARNPGDPSSADEFVDCDEHGQLLPVHSSSAIHEDASKRR
jgi:hypothetical protein